MKTIFIASLACLSIFCSNLSFHPQTTDNKRTTTDPTKIYLVDSFSFASIKTIECVKAAGIWVVSDSSVASNYLTLVSSNIFKNTGVSSFHDIKVEFDSLYKRGTLVGMTTKSGKNIPIGVEYKITISSSPQGLVGWGDPIKHHTCAGAPCDCCDFKMNLIENRIVGCNCLTERRCKDQGSDAKCNHTVTATEK